VVHRDFHPGKRLDRSLDRRGPPVTPRRGAADRRPLVHLEYAARYQEFPGDIEPGEGVCHLVIYRNDPPGITRSRASWRRGEARSRPLR
jgi:hypothetical protein